RCVRVLTPDSGPAETTPSEYCGGAHEPGNDAESTVFDRRAARPELNESYAARPRESLRPSQWKRGAGTQLRKVAIHSAPANAVWCSRANLTCSTDRSSAVMLGRATSRA